MNKLFSTLMATALVAGSVATNAAVPERPYEFRKADVRAAFPTKTVNQIQSDKWYQLRTSTHYNPHYMQADRPNPSKQEVLVQYRDMMTGKLYLRLVPAENAPLNPSLWKLVYDEDETVGGGKWKFINKETNVELTFDPAFAASTNYQNQALGDPSWMVKSCVENWEWYNTDSQNSSDFGEVAPYAYFTKDSVITMSRSYDGYVYSRKGSKNEMINNSDAIQALKIQPVEAAPITLDSYAFNSMIDYHKPSVDKKWAKFLFFEGKQGLDDAVEITPNTGGVMDADMAYQAEDDYTAILDFYRASVSQLGGTTNPDEYESALMAANFARLDLEDAERTLYGGENSSGAEADLTNAQAFKNIVESTIQYNEGELATLQNGFDAAYDVAMMIVATAESIDDRDLQRNNNYLTQKDIFHRETDSIAKIEAAITTGSAAMSVLTGRDRQKVSMALAAFDGEKETYYNNYKIVYNNLKLFKGLLATANENLINAQNAYKAALERYNNCEKALADAEARLNTYNVANAQTQYLLNCRNHFMKLQYMNDQKGTYLMVDTAFWQGNSVSPMNANLKLKHETYNASSPAPLRARFFYNFTYYPTLDSLVIEPLNASEKSVADYTAKKSWAESWVATHFAYGSDVQANASQASNSWTNNGTEIVLKLEDLSNSGNCLTAAIADAADARPLKCRMAFNNKFTHLKRATLNPGLYTIKAKDGVNAGRYLVDNFYGMLMYDVEELDAQDYKQMPATMWVVEKYGSDCGDLVTIHNREFGAPCNDLFTGQLYEEDGRYFIIDNTYGDYFGNYMTTERMIPSGRLLLTDNYEIKPVEDKTALTSRYHGYGYIEPEVLPYTNYALRYNHNNGDKYLNVQSNELLKVTTGDNSYYELDTVYAYNGTKMTLNEFGYGAGVLDANSGVVLPQLVRQRYVLKVKDVNLIDNDTTYVAMNTAEAANGYYIARGIKDIRANGLAILSSFYLKNDQVDGDATCYALIDTRINNCCEDWYYGYRRASVVDANGYVEYNTLNNNPNDRVSAFALKENDRPLYRSIPEANVNFFRTVGNVDQKLFEDKTNETGAPASNVIDGFSYLGLAQEKMNASDESKVFIVEPLRAMAARMPQYMLAIEKDTVSDGVWCNTNTHGYFESVEDAIDQKEDATHVVFYNGYTAGRFLVNLADSVTKGSHAYNHPDMYTYKGYAVRLGFIEGVHMVITPENAAKINAFLGEGTVKAGEFFYIPTNGKTLADLKNEQGKLIPGKLFDPANTDRREYTTGKHNNWSFSFRLIEDANEGDTDNFLIESNLDGNSAIGSWKGAWVKIYNNCPVVNYITGEHNSVAGYGLTPDNVTDGEVFSLTTTEGGATSNESIEAATVRVMAKAGAVEIAGAAGKKVVITNILGQVVANAVINSDNATIAAPAGVVVVSIEGEEAVKAIVK